MAEVTERQTDRRLQEEAILAVHARSGIAGLAEWAVAAANRVNKEEIYDLQRQVAELEDRLAGRDVPVEWDQRDWWKEEQADV